MKMSLFYSQSRGFLLLALSGNGHLKVLGIYLVPN